MGLFSSKKSTSNVTTNNFMSDQRAVGDNGALVVSGDVGGDFTMTDNEAVKNAFEFANALSTQSLNAVFSSADKAFQTAEKSSAIVSQAYQNARDPDPVDFKLLLVGASVLLGGFYLMSK